MKKQIVILVILLVHLTMNSQQLSTAGQSYLKFYKKNIEKLQKLDPSKMGYENEIDQAERQIKSLQKTDPSYDVSEMTNTIELYKSKLKEGKAKNDDIVKEHESLDDELEKFLNDEINIASSIAEVEQNFNKIKIFQTEFDTYIKNNLLKNDDLKFIIPKIETNWKQQNNDQSLIETYKNSIKNYTNPIAAENDYNKIKLISVKWSLLSIAFPQSTILKEAVNKANEALQIEGGKEGVLKIAKANKYERTKKVRMEPAFSSDPALETQIKTALQSIYVGKDKTILKTHILSSDWQINRHKITGVILGRYKKFVVAFKEKDGSCKLFNDLIQQDYDGSSYGKGYIVNGNYTGGYRDILCENVSQ